MAEGFRDIVSRHWRKLLAGAGGIAALALSVGLEIQGRRDRAGTPALELGEAVDLGPFVVTLTEIEMRDVLPDDSAAPGGRALWLHARVENIGSTTRTDLGEYLRIGGDDAPPVRPAGEAEFFLVRDSAAQVQLQPALPEDMILTAPVPADGQMQVTLFRTTWKRRDALSGRAGWYAPKPAATATLPVPQPATQAGGSP